MKISTMDKKINKKELPKGGCSYCWNKRYYTVLYGIHTASDWEMGESGHEEYPIIHKIACSKCNKNNKRRIKGVKANWWDN